MERKDEPARLVWVTGADPPFVLAPEMASVTLGRDIASDVVIPDRHASRLHAILEREGAYWVVSDVSRHGTEVGPEGRAAEDLKGGSRRLRHGDLLRLGSTVLRFDQPSRELEDFELTPPLEPRVYVTPRLMDVLRELAKPLISGSGTAPASNGEICLALGISPNTLKGYLSELYRRFGIHEDVGTPQQRRARLASEWHRACIGEGVEDPTPSPPSG